MKGRLIVLDQIAGREAAALLVDGVLEDLLIEPDSGAPPAPGSIFRSVADRPLKGQGGMMMILPNGARGLFRGAKGLSPGDRKLVMVTSYAEEGKAAPVTDRLVVKGRAVIVTPGASGLNISRQIREEDERERLLAALHDSSAVESGHGMIIRSNALEIESAEISAEADALADLTSAITGDTGRDPELLLDAATPHEMALRDWHGTLAKDGGFENNGVLDAIEFLTEPEIGLGLGSMYVEPTRALVAIDINTGADFSPASGLKANLAAARALPRQLRLRGLGGQIAMDLAPMSKKDRRQFEQTLRAAFRKDAVETSLVGWTPLGHFELQRKRERRPVRFETLL